MNSLLLYVLVISSSPVASPSESAQTEPPQQKPPQAIDQAILEALINRTIEIGLVNYDRYHGKLLTSATDKVVMEFESGDVRSFQLDQIISVKIWKPTASSQSSAPNQTSRLPDNDDDEEKAQASRLELRRARDANRAAERTSQLYSERANSVRAAAAAEASSATLYLAGGIGSCAIAASAAFGALFVCGVPLLVVSAISGIAGIGLFIAAGVTQQSAQNLTNAAIGYDRKASEAMMY